MEFSEELMKSFNEELAKITIKAKPGKDEEILDHGKARTEQRDSAGSAVVRSEEARADVRAGNPTNGNPRLLDPRKKVRAADAAKEEIAVATYKPKKKFILEDELLSLVWDPGILPLPLKSRKLEQLLVNCVKLCQGASGTKKAIVVKRTCKQSLTAQKSQHWIGILLNG